MIISFGFPMQTQQQTNWCWAAVSSSVSRYYNLQSAWTQCAVANAQLGMTTCCASPTPGACNVYGNLANALTTVGCLAAQAAGMATYPNVQAQTNAKRPLGIRVAWAGGGAHFIAGHGCGDQNGSQYLSIADPFYGQSLWLYNSLYRGSGTWTTTYYTQP